MKRKGFHGYLFILPLTALFGVFIVYPIVYNFIISFYDWNGIDIHKTFIGLKNYATILTDPVILKIAKNFVIFALCTIVIQAFLGLVFASFFSRRICFSGFYRIIFYLPVVATPAICMRRQQ